MEQFKWRWEITKSETSKSVFTTFVFIDNESWIIAYIVKNTLLGFNTVFGLSFNRTIDILPWLSALQL